MSIAYIEEALIDYENDLTWGEIFYYESWNVIDNDPIEAFRAVESFGAHEGAGENCWVVVEIRFKDGTVKTFKKEGYYASHYGSDWDGDFYEVAQVEKLVKVWEKV